MNDYISRTELSVDRGAARAPSAMSAIQPVSSSAATQQGGQSPRRAMPEDQPAAEESIASSAEYAKVHARIADILGDLRSQGGNATVQGAADEIQSMLPAPQVLIPRITQWSNDLDLLVRIGERMELPQFS